METILEIKNLRQEFGENIILNGINYTVKKGQTTCIIGPSGSGKSTLLRCVNLLDFPTSGEIIYKGQNVLNHKYNVAKYRAKIGMVFQQFNLFNNLNVLENCTVGQMHVLKRKHSYAKENAMQFLEKVQMEKYAEAKPSQLSGGQKQRVAIARALSMDPEIMLFDEPTSALDPETVGEVLKVIHQIAYAHMTLLIVTHEMEFAKDVSDNIIFMADGIIHEEGPPEEILVNPKNERTQNFLSRFIDKK